MLCYKCNEEICATDTVMTCEGFCENFHRFHARCVGLSEDEGSACLHRNIFWMCDCCRDLLENVRFRNIVNGMRSSDQLIKTDVEQMKAEIVRMSDMMGHIMETVAKIGASEGTMISSISEDAARSTVVNPEISSSPLSSTKLNPCDVDENVSVKPQNDTVLELHLSNIANDVSENEVREMVTNSIGAENVISIKCLVPPWKDASSLDWISFKVKVDTKCRDSVVRTANWPKGVRCRPFKNHAANNTWRPMRN